MIFDFLFGTGALFASTLPWVPWYVSKWLSSETRLRLSPLGRSVYLDLLFNASEKGSIPDDHCLLAKLADVSREEFEAVWPLIAPKFQPHPTEPGRLINPEMQQVVAERKRLHESKAAAGRAGGLKSGEARREAPASALLSAGGEAYTLHNNTKQNKNHLQSSPGGDAGAALSPTPIPSWKTQSFERFWATVWFKRDRRSALRAFCRAVRTEEDADHIIAMAKRDGPRLLSEASAGSRTPLHPATWLSGSRWEDQERAAVEYDTPIYRPPKRPDE
jgi:hypothetical protein